MSLLLHGYSIVLLVQNLVAALPRKRLKACVSPGHGFLCLPFSHEPVRLAVLWPPGSERIYSNVLFNRWVFLRAILERFQT